MKTAANFLLLTRTLAIRLVLACSLTTVHATSRPMLPQRSIVSLQVTPVEARTKTISATSIDVPPDQPQPPVIGDGGGTQYADVTEGYTITIRVVVTGTPPFTYQWQYNQVAIPGETNSELTLPDIQINQSGGYSVTVSNESGSAQSAVTYLNVVPAAQPGVIQFSQTEFDAVENFGSISIDVERSVDVNLSATVSWSIQGGTALPGLDYLVDASGQLTFEPGDIEKTIVVQILDDSEVEPTETISFSLHDPVNATLGEITTTTLNILDDDDDSIERPPLNVISVGQTLVFTWPVTSFGFGLEMTTDLTQPANWLRCEFPIQAGSSQNQVVLPNQNEQLVFFRLAPAAPPADVDIDVDTNRSGEIEDDADEEDEDKPVKFLGDKGALVLVNCNADRKDRQAGDGKRDMDDRVISGAEDEADMSPVSLELKRDLAKDEILSLNIAAINARGAPDQKLPVPIRFMDKVTGRALFGDGNGSRIDNFPTADGKKLFPDGKAIRYDGRFLLEGFRFATEAQIKLVIYNMKTKRVVAEDVVRVATTPWLANHHKQPLVDAKALGIPGNMVNSKRFPFAQAYGGTLVKAGDLFEFVQDGVEWGYQVRRQKPAEKSRTMITALRLYTEREDEHALLFAGPKVGVYGWGDKDESYFENKGDRKDGDQGGNVECLPPTDKYPFGRIIYGDYMSTKLKTFLTRQGAQFGLELKIAALGFPHVDEMIVVVPKKDGWVVLLPDWDAGRNILTANKDIENVPILAKGNSVLKYGEILDYIDNQDDGKKWAEKYRTGIAAVDKLLKDEAVQTLRLPGMFFVTGLGGESLRGWPRNIANCQVINPKADDPGTLVVSLPPQLANQKDDPFLTQWKAIFKKEEITIGLEDMSFAWGKGGEVHCSSNGIREPMKK